MGARLFERSTRKVELTRAGHRLREKALDLLADFDGVVREIKHREGTLEGHIRLMAPTTLTHVHLGKAIGAFLREHERITMEIALVDRSISPLEEEFDMAISGRAASFNGVVDVPLAPVHAALCAAPAYVARFGAPSHPHELAERDCLVFKPYSSNWQFRSAGEPISVEVTAKLMSDDNRTLMNAAIAGQGIAILPGYLAKDALAAGSLQSLLPGYPLQETWFQAYIPRRRMGLPRIRALLEWLKRHMEIIAPDASRATLSPRRVNKRRSP